MLDRIFLSAAETAEGLPPGGLLSFDMETILRAGAQAFNVLLIIFILAFVLYAPVKTFMAARTARIANDMDSARRDKEKAAEIKADYQKVMDNIDKEREEILERARRKANEEHGRIVADGHKAAEELKAKAHDEINIERANAADEIKKQIIEISTLIASRFVRDLSVDSATQDRYIDEALADWSESKYEFD